MHKGFIITTDTYKFLTDCYEQAVADLLLNPNNYTKGRGKEKVGEAVQELVEIGRDIEVDFRSVLSRVGTDYEHKRLAEILAEEARAAVCVECGGGGYGIYGQPSNTPCAACNP
jgi:hypothetical protein